MLIKQYNTIPMSVIPAGTSFYIPVNVKIPDDATISEELEIKNEIVTQIINFGITINDKNSKCSTTLYRETIHNDKYVLHIYSNDVKKLFAVVISNDDYIYICK